MKNNKCIKPKSVFSKPCRVSGRKKTPREGFFYGCHKAGVDQSPNIFCFNSRRCCASRDKVAVGRANKRPTPMGSPVSSQ